MGLKTPSRVRIPHSPPLLDSMGFPRGIAEKILTKWLTKQTCYCKIPLLFKAPVAQLDRAPGYELGGRRFESFRARQNNRSTSERSLVFLCPQVLCRGGARALPAANTRSVGRRRHADDPWMGARSRARKPRRRSRSRAWDAKLERWRSEGRRHASGNDAQRRWTAQSRASTASAGRIALTSNSTAPGLPKARRPSPPSSRNCVCATASTTAS